MGNRLIFYYIMSMFFSALPRHNKEEIDKDIDSVKEWIEKKKDEL